MERSGFFNAKYNSDTGLYDREYEVADFASYFASFIGNGVFPNPSDGLQVYETIEQDMNIIVKPGQGWINGYWYQNTDDHKIAIEPADGVLNRRDLIVLRYGSSERDIYLDIIKGKPAVSPTASNPQRNSDYYDLVLAEVIINAGVTKILQENIIDHRLDLDMCGLVTSLVTQLDTTTWGIQLNYFIDHIIDSMTEWVDQYTTECDNKMNAFYDEKGIEFAEWFDSIKGKLEGDVVTNLQLQIDNMSEELIKKNDEITQNFASIAERIDDYEISVKEDGAYITYDKNGETITKKLGSSEGTATTEQVLVGATFNSANSDDEQTGTMPDNGAVSKTLNCGSSYTIPKGYHNGEGKVKTNSLASQTNATAVAANLLEGKTAWVNGSKILGTMENKGTLDIMQTGYYREGYYERINIQGVERTFELDIKDYGYSFEKIPDISSAFAVKGSKIIYPFVEDACLRLATLDIITGSHQIIGYVDTTINSACFNKYGKANICFHKDNLYLLYCDDNMDYCYLFEYNWQLIDWTKLAEPLPVHLHAKIISVNNKLYIFDACQKSLYYVSDLKTGSVSLITDNIPYLETSGADSHSDFKLFAFRQYLVIFQKKVGLVLFDTEEETWYMPLIMKSDILEADNAVMTHDKIFFFKSEKGNGRIYSYDIEYEAERRIKDIPSNYEDIIYDYSTVTRDYKNEARMVFIDNKIIAFSNNASTGMGAIHKIADYKLSTPGWQYITE